MTCPWRRTCYASGTRTQVLASKRLALRCDVQEGADWQKDCTAGKENKLKPQALTMCLLSSQYGSTQPPTLVCMGVLLQVAASPMSSLPAR
jgi:hypothetical protein